MPSPPPRLDRRVPRRKRSSSPIAWVIAILVVCGAGVFFAVGRGREMSGAADVSIVRERTENILASWRDLKPPMPYDKSGDSLFSPSSWTITNAEVFETRGRSVISVESSTRGGAPVRVVWEMRFMRQAGNGWTCVRLVNAQDGYISDAWKF